MKRIVILGGSFNPVHNGHLRLAIEAGEAFDAERVDFVPSFRPPHKPQKGLLPYILRVKALDAALEEYTGIRINQFEACFDAPSYTYYTLQDYKQREPEAELFFVLGLADYAILNSWYNWEELITLCNFIVVPRHGRSLQNFLNTTHQLWPNSVRTESIPPLISLRPNAWPEAQQVFFLPVPRLDISSSLIREKWQKDRRLDFLVPQNVLDLLQNHADEVDRAWLPEGDAQA